MTSNWDRLGGLVFVLLGAVLVYVVFTKAHDGPRPGPVAPADRQQLVYNGGPACVHCARMERDTFKNHRVAERLGQFSVVKTSGRAANERYKVTALPTYLVLSADGAEMRRGSGYRGPDEFLAWLDGPNRREGEP